MLKVERLSLVKKGTAILENVSTEFMPGTTALLLGKSGSGKTSLLRCMAQLERGYTGSVCHRNLDLSRASAKQRCQTIGIVSQSYPLFPHFDCLDNCAKALMIHFGLKKQQARDRAAQALEALGMERRLHAKPHELSGGQQQRAAIARALVLNPAFLLLDEPTSALDGENTDRLIEILHTLQKEGRGFIISSQDEAFSQKLHAQVFVLEGGKMANPSS